MANTVTAPLERQFGQMAGLDRMSSTSAAGVSIITLQFSLGQTLDVAEQEVQAAINAGGSLLPADLPAPPVYAKVNPADAPVLTLAISSDTVPLTEVQNLVNTRLAQKISQVSGVGLVTLAGGQRPAVRIQADTQSLASYGIGIDTLRTAISAANANSAKGSFDGPKRSYSINANDQLLTADDYRKLIVAYKNNAPVRLIDVARVIESAENTRLGAWAGKSGELRPAIILNVQRQPGANVIATVDAIKKQLPELQASLPANLRVEVLSDRTTGIRASVEHVEIELVLAVVMVVLVIFAFLGSLRATVIASLAVPISLIGTCGAMYLLGYSLNNLSLMALTIATGFVVDDAIVMIENISRHLELARAREGRASAAGATSAAAERRTPQSTREAEAEAAGELAPGNAHRRRSRVAAAGPAADRDRGRARRRLGDRLHDHLAHRLADRGADPAALHERRRRPPVPRVRGDAGDHDPDLGGGLADAGADDVGALAGAEATRPTTRRARPGRAPAPLLRGMIDRYDHALTWVIDHELLTLAVARRDAGADRAALPLHPEGAVPDPGHGPAAGARRDRRRRLVRPHGRAAAGGRGRAPAGPGGRERQLVHRRRRRQQHDAAHRPDADRPQALARRPGRRDDATAGARRRTSPA